jgi:cardiolipin synthase
LGIQISGPVAQDAQRMFDDLWSGSEQRHCSDFDPAYIIWQATCRDSKAVADHVPEVLQYYLPGGDSVAFSMHRTQAYSESDNQIEQALTAAQTSIDAIHVNFTAEMVCDLNLIYNQVCTFEQALPYLDNMVTAVAENGVKLRILVKSAPVDGVETSVALDLLRQELAERGLSDQVEIRFFNGPVHSKATLIDNEFLIVGSQNFHYSAYGETMVLTEYNLGTADPQAVADFQRLFDYHWERAVTE